MVIIITAALIVGAAPMTSSATAKSLEYLCTYEIPRCDIPSQYAKAVILADDGFRIHLLGFLAVPFIIAVFAIAIWSVKTLLATIPRISFASQQPKYARKTLVVPANAMERQDNQDLEAMRKGWRYWVANCIDDVTKPAAAVPMIEAYRHYCAACAAMSPPCPAYGKGGFEALIASYMLNRYGTKPTVVADAKGNKTVVCQRLVLRGQRVNPIENDAAQEIQEDHDTRMLKHEGFSSWLHFFVDERDENAKVEAGKAWRHYCEWCRIPKTPYPTYDLPEFGRRMRRFLKNQPGEHGEPNDPVKNNTIWYMGLKLRSLGSLLHQDV